jgi:hypothetical protein
MLVAYLTLVRAKEPELVRSKELDAKLSQQLLGLSLET